MLFEALHSFTEVTLEIERREKRAHGERVTFKCLLT